MSHIDKMSWLEFERILLRGQAEDTAFDESTRAAFVQQVRKAFEDLTSIVDERTRAQHALLHLEKASEILRTIATKKRAA